MKIGEILAEPQVIPELRGEDKASVLAELATHLCSHTEAVPVSAEEVLRALTNREELGSTGVGEGVAIPHAKIPCLSHLVACFGRKTNGVGFDAIDQHPVSLIFVLLVPENSAGAHLKALARISRLLKDKSFRDRLLSVEGGQELYQTFLDEDAKY